MIRKTLKFLTLAAALSIPTSLSAQGLIRDAEIERSLKLIAKPLLQKAGLSTNSVQILVVNDRSMNAFVYGGRNIFIHSGLITRLKTVEQLQAVIAHEIGHITGGHLSQRAASAAKTKTAAGLGIALGAIAAAAGSGAGAIGLAAGAQSAAQRSFLGHTRAQEASADQSGIRYMAAAGIDPKAAIEVLQLFQGQDLLTATRRDPYALTHPISSARISSIKGFATAYKPKGKADTNSQYWYGRMRAKFIGFVGNPKSVLRRFPKSNTSEVAIYTRAIAYHKKNDKKRAKGELDKLLAKRPNDPYYNELQGQFYLENGNAKNAVVFYKKASNLAKKEPQILAGLGRAYNATGQHKEALRILKNAYSIDPRDGRMLRELALAYAKQGQAGWASLVTAERYALAGNFRTANTHATRAKGLFNSGSVGWLKAEDIIVQSKQFSKKK